MGLLTYSSQDAIDWISGEIKMRERPYVTGLMMPKEAQIFVDLVNLNSDKVAFWQEVTECEPDKRSRIALTKSESGARGYAQSMAEVINKDAGLLKNFPAYRVCILDPTWGRAAVSKDGLYNVVIKDLSSLPNA